MKRIIIIFILLFTYNSIESGEFNAINISIPNVVKNYKMIVIEYIKFHEGLRLEIYKDSNGNSTIGYGCRLSNIGGIKKITKMEADSLCQLMIDRSTNMIKHYTHNLKPNELYSLTHLCYCIGIGNIIKHKLIVNNKLDTIQLIKLNRPVQYYKFEKELFYGCNSRSVSSEWRR